MSADKARLLAALRRRMEKAQRAARGTKVKNSETFFRGRASAFSELLEHVKGHHY